MANLFEVDEPLGTRFECWKLGCFHADGAKQARRRRGVDQHVEQRAPSVLFFTKPHVRRRAAVRGPRQPGPAPARRRLLATTEAFEPAAHGVEPTHEAACQAAGQPSRRRRRRRM
jgi:hypothetical protein